MKSQPDHIAEAADLPDVTFQVIPFAADAHPGMNGEFVILRFGETVGADVIYIESMAGDAGGSTSKIVTVPAQPRHNTSTRRAATVWPVANRSPAYLHKGAQPAKAAKTTG